MRRALAIIGLGVALASCGDRRSFNERYHDTGAALANQAREMDANLADDNLSGPESNRAD